MGERKNKPESMYMPNVMKNLFLKEIELPQEQDVLLTKSDQDEHVKVQNTLIYIYTCR